MLIDNSATFSIAGGLTCRGVLQTTPNHSVKTFILLSSPQAGQFGGLLHSIMMLNIIIVKIKNNNNYADTDFLSWIVPNVATELIYK